MKCPAPGPNELRRPLWLGRPLRPSDEMFYVKDKDINQLVNEKIF
ncbi:MAG TPA: hypothetical protein PKE69_15020 [Pyrinomonadaceae bacterium]|nr:hypothetical protein [Pyrinomonadaceae bacterium]